MQYPGAFPQYINFQKGFRDIAGFFPDELNPSITYTTFAVVIQSSSRT